MFNRGVSSNVLSTAVLLVALTILVMASASAHSQSAGHLRVEVDHIYGMQLGQPFGIGIYLTVNDSAMQIGGFDFLLAYDANLATLAGARQGLLLNDCAWEYFAYRTVPADSCSGDCPSGMVRLVAVADINNGAPVPSCFGEQGGQLAWLDFVATSDSSQQCKFIPVSFFWLDCGDNVMSSITGDSLYVSDNVYLFDYWPAPSPVDTFPNYSGTPQHCIDSSQGLASRRIDFWGGGTDIQCQDSIDIHGDLNLNGIAYEIADWVLYRSYFLYGPEVFGTNLAAQIAASDCNADGMTLTVADMVYLGQVIVGDYPPNPSAPNQWGDTVILIQDTIAHTVSIQYPDSLSALHLIFAGEVVPDLNFPLHVVGAIFDSTVTRVLVAPDLDTIPGFPLIDSGLFFTYTGDGQLIAVDASYDGLIVFLTSIQGSSFPECCELRGDINSTGQIDVADLTFTVDYLFRGGPGPHCLLEANIDGYGYLMDISDLTYLVDFLFRGGPLPVPCP